MTRNGRFVIVLPFGMQQAIRDFLFRDPSREYLGVILAGVSRGGSAIRLLGREFVPCPPDEIMHQSGGRIEARSSFSQRLMQRCAEQGLSQIDVHSHPFSHGGLWFSGTDDSHERRMATYIYRHVPESFYASIVMDHVGSVARIWLPGLGNVVPEQASIMTIDVPYRPVSGGANDNVATMKSQTDDLYDRHVMAFGAEGQERMARATIGLVGLGGLGSVLAEGLARLGFGAINLIDPDRADKSNLNRVVGMTWSDAGGGVLKTAIAERMIHSINPAIQSNGVATSVFAPEAVNVLKQSDVVVIATDNHATRMFAQRLGAQYLIPVVSVGVNIDVEDQRLTDVSGEYTIGMPGPAGWCLACARAYDPTIAAWELADVQEQQRWVHRGYVQGADVPAPAVRHLNGVVADLALAEIHNLFTGFKDYKPCVFYDQLSTELMPVSIARDANCAVCSERALLGLGDLEPMPNYQLDRQRAVTLPNVPVVDSQSEQAEPITKEEEAPHEPEPT